MDELFKKIGEITDSFPGVAKLVAPIILFLIGILANYQNKRDSAIREFIEAHRREQKEHEENFRREYREKEEKLNWEIKKILDIINQHTEDVRFNRLEFAHWWAALLEFREELRRLSDKLKMKQENEKKEQNNT